MFVDGMRWLICVRYPLETLPDVCAAVSIVNDCVGVIEELHHYKIIKTDEREV